MTHETTDFSLPHTIAKTPPLIIGHRGASTLAPENTLAAFKRALIDGAAGVELDVRLARDGVPVAIHDATLRRTGLREGVVAKLTSSGLAQMDAGRWFNSMHRRPARCDSCRQELSTPEQALDCFQKRS